MKPIVTLALMAASLCLAAPASAQDAIGPLRDEVRDLRQEVLQLRQEVLQLRRIVDQRPPAASTDPAPAARPWACLLTDSRAGQMYGKGRTREEARADVMQQCAERRGACQDTSLVCSRG